MKPVGGGVEHTSGEKEENDIAMFVSDVIMDHFFFALPIAGAGGVSFTLSLISSRFACVLNQHAAHQTAEAETLRC